MAGYRRTVALVTASSFLVPVVGLATAPLLARELGVGGRGEVAAAMAPNLVIVTIAALGLPQALTYVVAKQPHLSRQALRWSVLVTLPCGVVAIAGTFAARSFLSAGDDRLADLILLATWLALPALGLGLLRGIAMGYQMWVAVAVERTIGSVLRLAALVALALLGQLDVISAIVVSGAGPICGSMVYLLVFAHPAMRKARPASYSDRAGREFYAFGFSVWLSSVATMLIPRLNELLITPLASVDQLGLFIVAVTISDVTYLLTRGVRDVVFGTFSAQANSARLLTTSRLATGFALIGSAIIAGTLPFWLVVVFGPEFELSLVSTWILLAASCIAVPGLVAGAGLDSVGRPGMRFVAIGVALLVDLTVLVVLAPRLGATGAALAVLLGACASSTITVWVSSRAFGVTIAAFIVTRHSDLSVVRSVARAGARAIGLKR